MKGDAEVIEALVRRAFYQGELKGASRPERADSYRAYTFAEVVQAMRTERYKQCVAEYQGYANAEAAERAKREQEKREAQERIQREIAAERNLVPHLFDLIEELQADVAELRSR